MYGTQKNRKGLWVTPDVLVVAWSKAQEGLQHSTYVTFLYCASEGNREDTSFCRKHNISFQVLVKLQMKKRSTELVVHALTGHFISYC